ncbi:gamma-glutamylcyclotransferase family protein [Roseibium salinum]|nr:gamma-glutamylcyclotransferase family protein [Roseibium salinum]
MVRKVFVFGTLKRGFPLHERGLSEAKLLGQYRTRERYPLLVAGPWFAPMMLNEPGIGYQVVGELYETNDITIENLERIESVGEPGNFSPVDRSRARRRRIRVSRSCLYEGAGTGTPCSLGSSSGVRR